MATHSRLISAAQMESQLTSIPHTSVYHDDYEGNGIVIGPPQDDTRHEAFEVTFEEGATEETKQQVRDCVQQNWWLDEDWDADAWYIEGEFPNEEYYEYREEPVSEWFADTSW